MEDTAEFGREIIQDSKAALKAHLPRGLTGPQIHCSKFMVNIVMPRAHISNLVLTT